LFKKGEKVASKRNKRKKNRGGLLGGKARVTLRKKKNPKRGGGRCCWGREGNSESQAEKHLEKTWGGGKGCEWG